MPWDLCPARILGNQLTPLGCLHTMWMQAFLLIVLHIKPSFRLQEFEIDFLLQIFFNNFSYLKVLFFNMPFKTAPQMHPTVPSVIKAHRHMHIEINLLGTFFCSFYCYTNSHVQAPHTRSSLPLTGCALPGACRQSCHVQWKVHLTETLAML